MFRLVPTAALALALAVPALAPAKTSHEGWPKIDGRFRIDRHDRGKSYHGSAKSDELLGGHGSNSIWGRASADVIWGDYKPCCQPTSQTDHLYGSDGDDWIYGSHGTNIISGGAGNDTIRTHWGRGTIDCGPGIDTLFISHRARKHYRVRHCERISFKTLGY